MQVRGKCKDCKHWAEAWLPGHKQKAPSCTRNPPQLFALPGEPALMSQIPRLDIFGVFPPTTEDVECGGWEEADT
jgi:hypothetical protein